MLIHNNAWGDERIDHTEKPLKCARVPSLASPFQQFWDADSFNSNLTAWNVSRLVDASGMLFGADRFNHSLCAWRTRLPAAVDVSQILVGTACSETARTDSDSVSDKSTDTLVLCVPCDNVLGL
jgi:Mycoplasma protein of unknown function, DUF285